MRYLFWSFKLKLSHNLFIWRLKQSIILVFIFQISLGVQPIQNLNNLGSITLPPSLLKNLRTEELDLASRIIFNFFKKTTVFQVFFGPIHKDFKFKLRAKYEWIFSPHKAHFKTSDLKCLLHIVDELVVLYSSIVSFKILKSGAFFVVSGSVFEECILNQQCYIIKCC